MRFGTADVRNQVWIATALALLGARTRPDSGKGSQEPDASRFDDSSRLKPILAGIARAPHAICPGLALCRELPRIDWTAVLADAPLPLQAPIIARHGRAKNAAGSFVVSPSLQTLAKACLSTCAVQDLVPVLPGLLSLFSTSEQAGLARRLLAGDCGLPVVQSLVLQLIRVPVRAEAALVSAIEGRLDACSDVELWREYAAWNAASQEPKARIVACRPDAKAVCDLAADLSGAGVSFADWRFFVDVIGALPGLDKASLLVRILDLSSMSSRDAGLKHVAAMLFLRWGPDYLSRSLHDFGDFGAWALFLQSIAFEEALLAFLDGVPDTDRRRILARWPRTGPADK